MKSIVGSEQETGIQTSAGIAQTDMAAYYGSTGQQQSNDFDISVVWHVLRRRWWLAAIVAFVVMAVGVYVLWIEKPLYESTAWILVSSDRMRSGTTGGTEETRNVDELINLAKSRSLVGQVEVLRSPDMQYDVINKLGYDNMRQGFGDEFAWQGALFPEWALTIENPEGSDLVAINTKAYDPQIAANISNTIARTYLERDRGYTIQATKQGREYVEKELDKISVQLATAQKELAQFKSSNNMVTPESQLSQASGDVTALEMEYDKARIEQAASSQRVALLREQLKSDGNEVQQGHTIVDNPLYKEAESNLNRLNIQRVVLLQDYTPQSNEVQRIDSQIAAVQQQMQGFSKQTIPSKTLNRNPYLDQYIAATIENTAATARLRALSNVKSKRSQQLVAMPEKERQYSILAQKVAFLNKLYENYSDKKYALLVNEKSTIPGALFVANAWAPIAAVNNKRKKIPQLAIIALLLAAGSILIAEKLDKKVRDETRMMRLTGEDPMAVIPRVKGLTNPFTRLVDTEDHSNFLEAFRILRNSIYYSDPNGAPKLLAISSPGHGEGKSTTSLCLAITVAMDSKKVLIIDCDFRRPSLYKWIKAPTDLGLSYVLAGEASVEEAIIPTSMPNLFCLPAGPLPANPSEFLNSRVSREIMNKLANEYDMVILDCPPCAGLSDMQIISRLVDGVLLVASIDHTLKKRLDEGFRMLTKVHAPLIGYVINRFNMNPRGYDYYASEDYDLPKWNKHSKQEQTTSITEVE